MNNYYLSDAHCHYIDDKDLLERIDKHIVSIISLNSLEEINNLLNKQVSQDIILSCGVHPWSVDKVSFEDMEKYMRDFEIIGEIGMDSVWCDTSLKLQEEVFRKELALAQSLKKPVILHTKGQEKEIAKIIAEYPNKYLIHWYSCDDYLDEYLKLDCYFSIGPDVFWNEATREVARRAPLNRILSETDGLNAVKWAYDEAPIKKTPASITSEALKDVIHEIASILKLTEAECLQITYDNLVHGFLNK